MRYLTFITTLLISSYSFAAASAAGLSAAGMRIMCQQYKGSTAQNTILIFEYDPTGLVEDTNTNIPGVEGTLSLYSDYTGEKLYNSKNSDTAKSLTYANILEKVTAPAKTVDGRVHLIANQLFIFNGVKNGEVWHLQADLIVQKALNSDLTVNGKGAGYKCLPAQSASTLEAKKSVTPDQKAYCEDAGIDLSECQGIEAASATAADQQQ